MRSLTDSVSRTASIIGVDIKVPGRNYKSPPAISFADKCGKGYGAHGEAIINEDGEVIGAIITSSGEGYPIVDDDGIDNNVGITTIFVEDPGTGYTKGDTIDEDVFVYDEGLPNTDTGNRWRFAIELCSVFGLRPEDLRAIYTKKNGQEIWSDYRKSKGGSKGETTEPRQLFPLWVLDSDGTGVDWNYTLKTRLAAVHPVLSDLDALVRTVDPVRKQ